MKKLLLVMMSLILVSCTKGAKSPEGLIKKFSQDVTTKKLDLDYYKKFTTGQMWKKLKGLTEEELEKDSRMDNVKDVDIEILSKSCEKNKCVLTYLVKYITKSSSEGGFESEVKKIAEVYQEDDYWKLAKVTNLKTFHESTVPINPMIEETPEKEYSEQD